jgi:Flp pilus assembly protein TadD
VVALIIEKIGFFALATASCVVTVLAQRAEAIVGLEPHPLDLRLQNAVVSVVAYLGKTLWPARLSVLYPLPKQIPWSEVLMAVGVLFVLSWGVWRLRRAHRCLVVGWLWFLGTLVPVLGLVQVGSQARADRYTYVPLIGLFIAIVFGGADLAARRRVPQWALNVFTSIVLLACAVATSSQLRHWRNSESLFTHALEVTRDNPIAHINRGVALEQLGRREEALGDYRAAVRLNPNLSQAHNNLANLLDSLGQPDEALVHYREALRLKPRSSLVHLNLGTHLVSRGQYDEGLAHYREAARLQPRDARPAYLAGKAMLRQERPAEAIQRFREALKLEPNYVDCLVLLARVLATDPDAGVRNGSEAVFWAERANALTEGQQPAVLDVQAMAYAESGRFDLAVETMRRALDLTNTADASGKREAMVQRVQLYQNRQAFRESATHGTR